MCKLIMIGNESSDRSYLLLFETSTILLSQNVLDFDVFVFEESIFLRRK